MKITKYKKQLIIALHLLFWFVSINAWSVVFNPGVESVSFIKGLQDYWPYLVLANGLFYLYCLLPFIWLSPKTWKWVKILLSVAFLIPLFYIVYQYLQPPSKRADLSLFTDYFIENFGYTVVFHLTIVAAVYFNLKVLIIRLLNRNKFGLYLLSFVALTCIAAVLNFVLFDYVIDQAFPNLYFISYYKVGELVLVIGAYLILTMVAFLVWQYTGMLIANREKVQHELTALKAQINPHFLFNNLNTIYSLASQKDERTKDVILQLSDFLRYVLYDTTNESIPLEKEVETIKKYVDLQKERINPMVTQVDLTTEGDFSNRNIAPLLLLPLAENCFKHGIGKSHGKIQIFIGIREKQLIFTTENTIAKREKTGEDTSGGIGIRNLKERLNLLYPDRYSLHFEEAEGIFRVELKIEL